MEEDRRNILLAGIGLALGGCGGSSLRRSGPLVLPGPHWPGGSMRPAPSQPATAIAPAKTDAAGPIPVHRRNRWAGAGPNTSSINPMSGVGRITIHHEGYKPVWFSDVASTRDRLELIRKSHRSRGWSDIGYHFILDRGGRVWEGRPVRYQGAHVRSNNRHNIGVMVLGNFERQKPSAAQLRTLPQFIAKLRRHYKVEASKIYTHRELVATSCPGKNLQPQVVAMRRQRLFA
ncbi:MAG: peptidoglycan recognition family protein [Phycisphaeraceae bacterium]|nr:peptidoglycan recognition family protein [Phycisphaeraceae bacterium]